MPGSLIIGSAGVQPFGVVGRRRDPESDVGEVFLLVADEELREPGGVADEQDEQAGRERIERAGVADARRRPARGARARRRRARSARPACRRAARRVNDAVSLGRWSTVAIAGRGDRVGQFRDDLLRTPLERTAHA